MILFNPVNSRFGFLERQGIVTSNQNEIILNKSFLARNEERNPFRREQRQVRPVSHQIPKDLGDVQKSGAKLLDSGRDRSSC